MGEAHNPLHPSKEQLDPGIVRRCCRALQGDDDHRFRDCDAGRARGLRACHACHVVSSASCYVLPLVPWRCGPHRCYVQNPGRTRTRSGEGRSQFHWTRVQDLSPLGVRRHRWVGRHRSVWGL